MTRLGTRSLALGSGAIVLGALLVATLAWGLQHAALVNPPVLGRAAPALAIQTLAGDQVAVDGERGRPVVLNFWASWCTSCLQEGSVLSAASSAHPNLSFIGADSQDTGSGFRTYESRHPHVYPAGPIVRGTYQSYGVAGLPVTFFIDAGGIVVASFSGPLDMTTLDHYIGLIAS